MSLTNTTIKSLTVALALGAIAAPTAGAQAPVPPPPGLPPASAEITSTAPAGDTTPAPAADIPTAPAHSESPAPTSSSTAAGTQQSAPAAPPVVKVSKAPPVVKRKAVKRHRKVVKCRRTKHHRTRCAVKRHTVRHRKHAVKGRAAAVTPPWSLDAEPMCSYNTARQDIIGTIPPAMSIPTGASAGYLAYQPLYYYYNFTTGQWTYAASGEWMWSYRDAAFGTRRWQFFTTALQADLLGEQDMTVSRGYYWKVAVRHYWYPTSTTAGISAPLRWAPRMETNFVPSDIFAASLYTPTYGDYCYSV